MFLLFNHRRTRGVPKKERTIKQTDDLNDDPENPQEPSSENPDNIPEGISPKSPRQEETTIEDNMFSIENAVPDSSRPPDHIYKIIIIGNSGVGKSNLLGRWLSDRFETKSATIAADVSFKSFEVDGKLIKVQFWDTAGQEAHFSITQSYFRKTQGAIIVYDVTNASSFFDVNRWVKAVKEVAGNEATQFILIGNKMDLNTREVTTPIALEFARREELNFLETSALTGNNVNRAFQLLLQDIHKETKRAELEPQAILHGSIFDLITEGRTMTVNLSSPENEEPLFSCCTTKDSLFS